MFVKPKAGLVVRDPITKFQIPDSGRDVPESTYWVRRVKCGDVVVISPDAVVVVNQIPDSHEEHT